MWLTRFAGDASSSSAGIAFQGSLSPVDVPEASRPSVSIAAPLAAMVASPRTAVTTGQQNANVNATLPAFQPGSAPTIVPDSSSTVGAGVLAAIAVLGIMFISRFRVR